LSPRVERILRSTRRSGGAGLFEVPRLEELVADPEKVRVLDAHTTRVLTKQAIIALNLLYDSELERNATSADSMTTTRDRLLGVEEAGARLGVIADWLYRHHKDLPFTVRCGRLLRFSQLGIEQYIRKRRG
jgi:predicted DNA-binding transcriptional regulator AlpA